MLHQNFSDEHRRPPEDYVLQIEVEFTNMCLEMESMIHHCNGLPQKILLKADKNTEFLPIINRLHLHMLKESEEKFVMERVVVQGKAVNLEQTLGEKLDDQRC